MKQLQKETKGDKQLFAKPSDLFRLEDKRYTTEETIPYRKMYQNGICQLDERHYNKMIEYQDINYQLVLDEDKNEIFNQFAGFLNSFSPDSHLQLYFLNETGRLREMKEAIEIPDKSDNFQEIRLEFREMLREQLEKGSNGLKRTKYVVFGVEADTYKEAKVSLSRMEIDVLSHLKGMGVVADTLTGIERLRLLHNCLNPHQEFKPPFGNIEDGDSRSYVVPNQMTFPTGKYLTLDKRIGATSHFQIMASELSDRFLAELLAVDESLYLSLHIHAVEQIEAIKMVKRKYTDVQKMIIEEQTKAVRSGYDMDMIPSDLSDYANHLKDLLHDLQNRDEKMFMVTVVMMNLAQSKSKLETVVSQMASICTRHNCALKRLDYQQEQGLIACLPLGLNPIPIERQLTSSSTAVFIPFTTQELFMRSKTSLYYRLNALSHNLLMADRKQLKNPNGLILGTPGSGKSFSAKREMANCILVTDDDVIICDPEGEYGALVEAFDGEVVKISAKSKDFLNPLDINMNYGDGDAPLKDKANFIMSLLDLVVGGGGLTAAEKSVIDRCLPKIYETYFHNPIPENMPILTDLYNLLKEQEETVGRKLATEMEIYVTGSLNVFNHQSNVDLNKSLLCFDIKELGNQLKKIGMLVIQDQVWNKVSQNREHQKSTRYYIDEFHLLLKDKQTAQYSVEIWKRFRKWGGIPTGITQNVKDLLASPEIENIFDNTDFVLMLNQASGDRETLA